MSEGSNIADAQRDMAANQGADTVQDNDRRKNERQIATFRTCCVVIDGEAHPAILRNMSDGGAMFEALVTPREGDRISYWWDGIDEVKARVAWVKGTRIGVANLSGPAHSVPVPRPRATRVPVNLPVKVWTAMGGQQAELDNISMSGIALHGLRGIEPGTLCTIEISGETLHNASVVRIEGAITGIRFERPLPPARLMQLIEAGGGTVNEVAHPVRLIGKVPAPEHADESTDDPVHEPEAKPLLRRFV